MTIAKKERKRRGPPRRYSELYPAVVRERTMLGESNVQIAEWLGINRQTLLLWRRIHPEFAEAYEAGRNDMARYRISRIPTPPMFAPEAALPERPETVTEVEFRFVKPSNRSC
jgi:hypothetical protein